MSVDQYSCLSYPACKAHAPYYKGCPTRYRTQHSFNPLTPNDHYSGRTVSLTSRRCILYFYSTNIGTEYFKHDIHSPCFSLQNAVFFHNSKVFGSCIIHILYTGCAKIKKNNSGVKRLIILPLMRILQWNLKQTTDTFLFISHTTNLLLFKFRCNIFIGVRIIKEMSGSVASGTPCIIIWPFPLYHIFPCCLIKGTIFEKKMLLVVLTFCAIFVSKISILKKEFGEKDQNACWSSDKVTAIVVIL
jgi:hypothetical protein